MKVMTDERQVVCTYLRVFDRSFRESQSIYIFINKIFFLMFGWIAF